MKTTWKTPEEKRTKVKNCQAKAISEGRCPRCGNKREQGRKRYCESCQTKINIAVAKLQYERIKKGQCVQCGCNPPLATLRRCTKCRNYHIEYNRNRKANVA